MKRSFLIATVILLAGFSLSGLDLDLSVRGETGITSVLWHTIRFGTPGTGNDLFDYRSQGGQEVLFPFFRFSTELTVSGRHEVELVYQPLTFETKSRIPENETITIDGVAFEGSGSGGAGDGRPLDLVYGFDFWRGTYRYRFVDTDRGNISFGGGLQLRNARISFETTDGELRVVSQDLGPVPVLSLAGRREIGVDGFFLEGSLEGFYAPIRYLNLRDVDVIGWLYDAAFRAGFATGETSEAFIGLRALGGGADGTGRAPDVWTVTQTEPRYTWNNLNLLALTIGARLR
ncbi:MAG: hypothetical protein EA383_10005 [Spirochaetaceae bacterium]|nr:MAG: hypothetical protein EA383_10005 [Spirochaetaceae bacterium]